MTRVRQISKVNKESVRSQKVYSPVSRNERRNIKKSVIVRVVTWITEAPLPKNNFSLDALSCLPFI